MTDKPPAVADDVDGELESPWRANVAAVEKWTADDWVTWLYQALYDRPRNRKPLMLASDSDLPTELASLHKHAPAAVGETLKSALVRAIRECPLSKGAQGLRVLALLTARLRASRAIPSLIEIVTRHRAVLERPDAPRFDAIQECVAVLAGFVPDDRIAAVFEGLMFDDAVAPQLSALFMPALVACDVDQLPRYADRYVQRRKEIHGGFADRIIILELFRAIPPMSVKLRFKELSEDVREYLMRHGGPLFRRHDVFGVHAFDEPRVAAFAGLGFNDMVTTYDNFVPAGGVLTTWARELDDVSSTKRLSTRGASRNQESRPH